MPGEQVSNRQRSVAVWGALTLLTKAGATKGGLGSSGGLGPVPPSPPSSITSAVAGAGGGFSWPRCGLAMQAGTQHPHRVSGPG